MFELILFALLLIFIALVYVCHKVRKCYFLLFTIADELQCFSERHLVNETQQWQALEILRDQMALQRPLPLTRGWAASPDFLLKLANYIAESKPRGIVECGSGTSTVILARAAQLNGVGHVFSLDHEKKFAQATRRLLEKYNLQDWATVLDSPLIVHKLKGEEWPWYDEAQLLIREIDLLVIDGPPMSLRKHSRYPAGPILLSRLSEEGVIFLDDANRQDETEIVSWWLKENPELESTRISLEKGCVIIRKKSVSRSAVE